MQITLDISDKALRKLRSAGMVSAMKGESSLADLLLFKILDGIENNKEVVEIRAKEDKQ